MSVLKRIADAPPTAAGAMVGVIDGEDEGLFVVVQLERIRFVLDAEEARRMAGAMEHCAAIVEIGALPPGAQAIPFDAPESIIAESSRRNANLGRA